MIGQHVRGTPPDNTRFLVGASAKQCHSLVKELPPTGTTLMSGSACKTFVHPRQVMVVLFGQVGAPFQDTPKGTCRRFSQVLLVGSVPGFPALVAP